MKESEQNIGFTLLGFAKYIYQNIFKSFSFLIYFRQNNAFPVSKISFNLIIKFAIRLLQENLEQKVTCPLSEEGSNVLSFNCTVPLQEENDIKSIQAVENSFTFDNIPLNLILSPIAQKSMQNIQKETGDKFEIFFKNSIQLYSLDNAFLSMDSRKKKFFTKGGKMKRQNQEENSKNQEKTENLEGNYVFPFEDQISN